MKFSRSARSGVPTVTTCLLSVHQYALSHLNKLQKKKKNIYRARKKSWIVKTQLKRGILTPAHTDLQHRRTQTRTQRAWVRPGRPGGRAPAPRRLACRCVGHILQARRTSPPRCCSWELSARPKHTHKKTGSKQVSGLWPSEGFTHLMQEPYLPGTCRRPDPRGPRTAEGSGTLRTPLELCLWVWEAA